MTDRQALLAAIIANPDEDTPRLAFADLLDETGDAFFADWAELIRTQIEFAREERYSPRWIELARRQVELFDKRKRDWSPQWSSRLGPAAFRRGFKEAHRFSPAEEFLRHADMVFGGSPIRAIRFLSLGQAGHLMRQAFVNHPGLERVETLDVGNNAIVATTSLLRQTVSRMPRLRALGLRTLGLTAPHAAALLTSLAVRNLEALDLSDNDLFHSNDREVNAAGLFHSPSLASLHWLDLHATHPTADAVHALAHSPTIRKLRYLHLGAPTFGQEQRIDGSALGEALAHGAAMRGLEQLHLTSCHIGSHGLAHLVGSSFLSTIRELNLMANDIGDAGAELLAACPHVAGLRWLDLRGNGLTPVGVKALLASPHLSELRILELEPSALGRGVVELDMHERFSTTVPTSYTVGGTSFFEPIP